MLKNTASQINTKYPMKINKYKNIILSVVILAAANLTFADEILQTREVNNAELKFEWSSITSVFKNELKNDASAAWNWCKTQIMNHQISKTDLSMKVYDLMNVDDPKNNASEKLVRACVADSLTGRLSRYMDDQRMKNPPVDEIVNTVLDMLQGKEDAVSQNIVPTDKNISNYVAQYNEALGAALALTNYVNEIARIAQLPAPTSANGGLVDMDELARQAASKMIENVRGRGEKVQGELAQLMSTVSTNVNSETSAMIQNATNAMAQLKTGLDQLEKDLKKQIVKHGKDLKERMEKENNDLEERKKEENEAAKKTAAKETAKKEDLAAEAIQDFLIGLQEKDFINSLKTNKTALIAVEMLKKYPQLNESAKIDKDESREKAKARVIKVLDELYGSK